MLGAIDFGEEEMTRKRSLKKALFSCGRFANPPVTVEGLV